MNISGVGEEGESLYWYHLWTDGKSNIDKVGQNMVINTGELVKAI